MFLVCGLLFRQTGHAQDQGQSCGDHLVHCSFQFAMPTSGETLNEAAPNAGVETYLRRCFGAPKHLRDILELQGLTNWPRDWESASCCGGTPMVRDVVLQLKGLQSSKTPIPLIPLVEYTSLQASRGFKKLQIIVA